MMPLNIYKRRERSLIINTRIPRDIVGLGARSLLPCTFTEHQGLQWLDQTAVKMVRASDETARFGTPYYKIQFRFGLKLRF